MPNLAESDTANDPWRYEKEARKRGFLYVAGVDEAGRGPIAGPVVAAAVILPEDFDCSYLRDSKAMTPKQRESAYERIISGAISVGIGKVDSDTIDEINILRAAIKAMEKALQDLRVPCDLALVDGLPVTGLPVPSWALVKGDSISASIMAASIVAKVTRDRIMLELDRKYPQYGFGKHKGYATRTHLAAISRWGVCECHRKSFSPVRERMVACRLPGLE
ncbi:MAG: ribonuclease HII [Armatimonadota bacterium]|nr:ribonuclease HII [Armatimonadota bacterium]